MYDLANLNNLDDYFSSQPREFLSIESVKLDCLGISNLEEVMLWGG